MKVWVIMGNDYPDAVFTTKASAEAYCAQKRVDNEREVKHHTQRKIYWRAYEFTVQPLTKEPAA